MSKWLVLSLAAIIGILFVLERGTMETTSGPIPLSFTQEEMILNELICRPKWLEQSHADLKRHEGFRPYAYPDPLSALGRKHGSKFGYKPARQVLASIGGSEKDGAPWTVGYGFTHGVTPNTTITQEKADEMLYDEIMKHSYDLDDLVPNWHNAPLYVQTVLVNLVFNMGKKGLSTFKNSLKLFNAGEYVAAADNLKKSLWYKQTGNRAVELTARLSDGSIPTRFAVIV